MPDPYTVYYCNENNCRNKQFLAPPCIKCGSENMREWTRELPQKFKLWNYVCKDCLKAGKKSDSIMMAKCKYCNRQASRNAYNPETSQCENLCELHYALIKPSRADKDKVFQIVRSIPEVGRLKIFMKERCRKKLGAKYTQKEANKAIKREILEPMKEDPISFYKMVLAESGFLEHCHKSPNQGGLPSPGSFLFKPIFKGSVFA